jgi:hypothetical protein
MDLITSMNNEVRCTAMISLIDYFIECRSQKDDIDTGYSRFCASHHELSIENIAYR